MPVSLDIIRDLINSKVRKTFEHNGFRYKKNNNTYVRNCRNEEEFRIEVKRRGNSFNIHLILSVYNSQIGLLREEIKNLVPIDNQSLLVSEAIKKSIKKNYSLLASLTDWKSIDEGNKLHIWFESFNDIEEISDIDSQLNNSIELSLSWFRMCEDQGYLVRYNIERGMECCIETALLILYYNNDLSELRTTYEKVLCNRKHKKLSVSSIERFYNALCRHNCPEENCNTKK